MRTARARTEVSAQQRRSQAVLMKEEREEREEDHRVRKTSRHPSYLWIDPSPRVAARDQKA